MNAKQIYWAACVGVCAVALIAALGSQRFDYRLNMTHSLPGTLYLVDIGAPIARGDLMAFRWHGGANYPQGVVFIKVAQGVGGDVVRREGQKFWVNQTFIGVAKTMSRTGVPMISASAGVIAPAHYFVATSSPDSLDSRYQMSGNIAQSDVLGRAYEIF